MDRPNKLDNPVWHSLNESHREFSLTYGKLKCYQVEHCPFGGYENEPNVSPGIDEYSKLISNFFIVGEKPEWPSHITLKKELVCLQMVTHHRIDVDIREKIERLNDTNAKELFDLVNLVQPGYFRSKTRLLGDYFGIYKDDKLIAVTGERMKMNDQTEVSAVVTHPGHTGKGYAKQLVGYTVNKIFDEGKLPFLHVAEINVGAIQLYEKLGFVTRRKISFWNFEKK